MSELHNQVMWNRLISIVEEQALALVRAAFSTSVREAGDLSAGVYDVEGRMIAQAIIAITLTWFIGWFDSFIISPTICMVPSSPRYLRSLSI